MSSDGVHSAAFPVSQTTDSVLMVRPSHFGPNRQTAGTNQFQVPVNDPAGEIQHQALAEFDGVIGALLKAGAKTVVIPDDPTAATPDALFPNNWISCHHDGTVVLYPLAAPNRRRERRAEILDRLAGEGRFLVSQVIDISGLESQGHYLEGTGSLVFDHVRHRAFAALSPRTHPLALERFTALTGWPVTAFRTDDGRGRAVYHTNVMLSIGSRMAVVCAEAFAEPLERRTVRSSLADAVPVVVEISREQMGCFAGNCLELQAGGHPLLVLSGGALNSLTSMQRRALERECQLLPLRIPTIERVGGGGVRCLLAEVHLPRTSARL